MSARERRLMKRLLQQAEAKQQAREQEVVASPVKMIQLSETIILSAPEIPAPKTQIPAPRLYTGRGLSPEEQDVFESLIEAVYEGDR